MRDSKLLLKLVRLRLQSDPPPAAIIKDYAFRRTGPPAHHAAGIIFPAAPEPEKLELTMARLANLVGEANVGSPQLMDTHRPDAIRMERFRLAQETAGGRKKSHPWSPVKNPQFWKSPSRPTVFGFFGPGLPARVELRDGLPGARYFFRACAEKWWPLPGRGALRETGGRTPGIRRSGMWKFSFRRLRKK